MRVKKRESYRDGEKTT
uniref:Uncharacterized protein n=1 Tax=Arundo donax TaxID=35708 RepID=A0A0A9AEC2_ARUDO